MVLDYRLLEVDSSIFAHQFHTSMVGERDFELNRGSTRELSDRRVGPACETACSDRRSPRNKTRSVNNAMRASSQSEAWPMYQSSRAPFLPW